ncbi:phage tail protein [Paenibacillus lautus]
MYNKQVWKDEIPDLARPILDGSGKQKTDPQTGRPLFELVQEGTRITSARLNTMEGGIEAAHTLVEQLAKEIGGNFVAVIDGVMGLQCSAQGLTATWTAGIAYVSGRRYEVSAGSMPLNPTQGQYLYVDVDGIVKKTTSQATAKTGVLLFYVATDTSGVISSSDERVNISLEEILKKIENIDVNISDASLTEKGIVQLSNATNGNRENVAPTEKALGEVMKEALAGKQLGVEQKANVVAVLNSKGITASTSETWAELILKLTDPNLVNASDATLPELHSGLSVHMIQDYVAYGKDGKRLVGAVPDISGTTEIPLSDIQNPQAQPSFRFPVPYGAYRSSGSGNYMRVNVPELIPGNLPKDVTLFNVKGILERMTTAEKQAIANAITGKGVAASANDTNTVLANKISQIQTSSYQRTYYDWSSGTLPVQRGGMKYTTLADLGVVKGVLSVMSYTTGTHPDSTYSAMARTWVTTGAYTNDTVTAGFSLTNSLGQVQSLSTLTDNEPYTYKRAELYLLSLHVDIPNRKYTIVTYNYQSERYNLSTNLFTPEFNLTVPLSLKTVSYTNSNAAKDAEGDGRIKGFVTIT